METYIIYHNQKKAFYIPLNLADRRVRGGLSQSTFPQRINMYVHSKHCELLMTQLADEVILKPFEEIEDNPKHLEAYNALIKWAKEQEKRPPSL